MLRNKLVAFVLLIPLLLAFEASASPADVTRTLSYSTVLVNQRVIVTLNITISGESYIILDELYPENWTVIDTGGLDNTEAGHLKHVDMSINFTEKIFTYIIEAPNATGLYTFNGTYQAEGMGSPSPLSGQDTIKLFDGHGQYYPSNNTCVAENKGFKLTADECKIFDPDGNNITQHVTFKWTGGGSHDTDWYFAYTKNLTAFTIEKWSNITDVVSYEEDGSQYLRNLTVNNVQMWQNLGTPDSRCKWGNINNTKMFNLTIDVESGNITGIACFTSFHQYNSSSGWLYGNWTNKTLVPVAGTVEGWNDVTNNVEYAGYNKLGNGWQYYKVVNFTFTAGKTVESRWTYSVDPSIRQEGKWFIFGKLASDTLADAITDDNFIFLDPWWNATYLNKRYPLNVSYYVPPTFMLPANRTSFSDIDSNNVDEMFYISDAYIINGTTEIYYNDENDTVLYSPATEAQRCLIETYPQQRRDCPAGLYSNLVRLAFDEDSGDAWGSGDYALNGTVHGATQGLDGLFGKSYNFTGSGDNVTLWNSEDWFTGGGNNRFTIFFWAKADFDLMDSQNHYLWGTTGRDAVPSDFFIRKSSTNKFQFWLGSEGCGGCPTYYQAEIDASHFNSGEWLFFYASAMVNYGWDLSIVDEDGNIYSDIHPSPNEVKNINNDKHGIGKHPDVSGEGWIGQIDEFNIFYRTRYSPVNDTLTGYTNASARRIYLSEEIDNPPAITVHLPANTTYSQYTVPLNVTADRVVDTWWYSLNGASNMTFTPNTTITGTDGTNHLIVYANDSINRVGSTERYFRIDFSTWWNSGWQYRLPFDINTSVPKTNIQVKINVSKSEHMKSDYSDLRVLSNCQNDGVVLNAWNQSQSADHAIIWFDIETVSTNNTFCLYYGNLDASSIWDGNLTFPFFDNYESWNIGEVHGQTVNGITYSCSDYGVAPEHVIVDSPQCLSGQCYFEPSDYRTSRCGQAATGNWIPIPDLPNGYIQFDVSQNMTGNNEIDNGIYTYNYANTQLPFLMDLRYYQANPDRQRVFGFGLDTATSAGHWSSGDTRWYTWNLSWNTTHILYSCVKNITVGNDMTCVSDKPFRAVASGYYPDSFGYQINDVGDENTTTGAFIDNFFIANVTEFVYAFGAEEQGTPWYADWEACRNITIDSNKIGETLTNFPMLVFLDNSTGNYSTAKFDWSDIRFKEDGCGIYGAELDYEIENHTIGNATIWVRVPSVSHTTDTVISVYYDNPDAIPAQDPTGVWDSNYIAVWHFNGFYGDPFLVDSTSNQNNMTPVYFDVDDFQSFGQIDGAVGIEGGEYANVSSSAGDDLNPDNITVEIWARLDSTGQNAGILTKYGNTAGTQNYGIYVDPPYYKFVTRTTAGTGVNVITAVDEQRADQWDYFAMTFDGSIMRGYINGTQVGTDTDGTGLITESAQPVWLGMYYSDSYTLDAQLDEARISRIPRSASWINASYLNQYSPSGFYSIETEERNITAVPLSLGAVSLASPVDPVESQTIQIVAFVNATGSNFDVGNCSLYKPSGEILNWVFAEETVVNSTFTALNCTFNMTYYYTNGTYNVTVVANTTDADTDQADTTFVYNLLSAFALNETVLNFSTLVMGENSTLVFNMTNTGNQNLSIEINGTDLVGAIYGDAVGVSNFTVDDDADLSDGLSLSTSFQSFTLLDVLNEKMGWVNLNVPIGIRQDSYTGSVGLRDTS